MRYVPKPLSRLKRRLLGQPDGDMMRKLEGEREILARYKRIHQRELNLANPTTFSEKMYRRLLDVNQNGNPQFTRLADKLFVRDYIAERVGAQFLTPLLWSGAAPRDIPFDQLPENCIAKTNHGSGKNIVLRKPIDQAALIAQLNEWLSQNFYWAMQEGALLGH